MNRIGDARAFAHPFLPELPGTLPADISSTIWQDMSRHQSSGFSGHQRPGVQPPPTEGASFQPEAARMELELLRHFYDASISERHSRMLVFWGRQLLAALRHSIPDMETPSLVEAFRVQAHLAAIGFSLNGEDIITGGSTVFSDTPFLPSQEGDPSNVDEGRRSERP